MSTEMTPTNSQPRGEFSSKIGFVLAAAGSAVGLGNIWGFPTNTASNGGAAFVFVYLILAFCLAYPALMAELIIGRHAKANVIKALSGEHTPNALSKKFGILVGILGLITVSLILSFYSIVAGWMVSFSVEPIARLTGNSDLATWLTTFSSQRNLLFNAIFMFLTILIILGGVQNGIERWSVYLMPSLFVILFGLIIYLATQNGAAEGFKAYLIPDFSRITDPKLIISAMGQAFFSLSLGVGTMLIYGSYISPKENIIKLGTYVTLIDVGIAFCAGLLILPAMYVAQANGVQIFSEGGALISGPDLILQVLPSLFKTMGGMGVYISFAFFLLMTIAALTSSISMLEVPVSWAVENHNQKRSTMTWLIGITIFLISTAIIFNFGALFGLVITITTEYAEPILGICFCIFAGWIWHRNSILEEIKKGYADAENSLFWKIWPGYIRYVCPLFILIVLLNSIF